MINDVNHLPDMQAWSFVIRIWLENDFDEHGFWRGHITHIPSNQRLFFQELEDMQLFVQSFLPGINKNIQKRDE